MRQFHDDRPTELGDNGGDNKKNITGIRPPVLPYTGGVKIYR